MDGLSRGVFFKTKSESYYMSYSIFILIVLDRLAYQERG